MIKNTAIIFFSRSARAEIKHKTFCGSNAFVNRSVSDTLYIHALQEVKRAGLPCFVYDEHNQEGSNFGERLSKAFSEVFALGYTAAIAVGSDSPGLSSSHLQEATLLLKDHPFVAGPTQAGGCYLLGMQQQFFQPSAFAALPWQTPALMQELLQQHIGQFQLLKVETELNNEAQVRQMVKQPLASRMFLNHFIQLLRSLFNITINSNPPLKLLPALAGRVSQGRAP